MPSSNYPGRRISYDTDGTRGFVLHTERLKPDEHGTLTQLPPMALSGLNSDHTGGLLINGRRYHSSPVEIQPGIWGEASTENSRNFMVLFFAEPMRLRGWYAQAVAEWQADHLVSENRTSQISFPEMRLEVSTDTTSGLDGTWWVIDHKDADQFTIEAVNAREIDSFRTTDGQWIHEIEEAEAAAWYAGEVLVNPVREEFQDGRETGRGWFPIYGGYARNIVAVRLSISASHPLPSLRGAQLLLHLYGEPDHNAGEVRLAVVDPLTDEELTVDPSWGDVDVQDQTIFSVGIKNVSTTMTAEAVEVSIASAYPDGTPTTVLGDTNGNGFPDTIIPWFVNPLEGFLHLSLDETTWAKTISLGDLNPEQTVEVFARQSPVTSYPLPPFAISPPQAGAFGLRFAKITAVTEGWV